MNRIRQRLTFANVVSVVALFVALGGGAYAVTVAKKNSVVSKSIKNGQVKKADVAKNAINGAKVADNSLSGADINESSLSAAPSGSAGGDLAGSYPNPTLAAPPAWQDVTFAMGWSNFGLGGAAHVQCYKDTAGVVHLRGYAIQGSGATGSMFTLPADCRPSYALEPAFPELNNLGTGSGVGVGVIDTDGSTTLETPLPGLNGSVGVDGISFRPTN